MAKSKKQKLEELKVNLKKAFDEADEEDGHLRADRLLLDYIGDEEVSKIFNSARKWYA